MSLSTVNELTAVKAAYDEGRQRSGALLAQSWKRALAATECDKSASQQPGGTVLAAGGGEANEPELEDGTLPAADAFLDWTAALAGLEDEDQVVFDDPRGDVPAFLAFDFSVPPVPALACPWPAHDVLGYPQEVVCRLRNFRAAEFPLRHIAGCKAGGQFAVDMCALMHVE